MSCSSDDQSDKECPLCMEPLEIDDVDFYPCKCEYQICRFCWHRLKNDENGLCPACRQPYPEDPVNFKAFTSADLQRIKDEKKLKQQAEKLRVSESRKHLANYRVLQKNLVYVVGLSPRVATEETLKKTEYFGRFGKIVKIVTGMSVNSTLPSHLQPSHTAYVTYSKVEDALKAIQCVNNTYLDGRMMKASLGTTKYCSSFLRSQTCGKPDCMYLHDIADKEISFTKEDMHLGKHTEYEKKLIDITLRKAQQERKSMRTTYWDQIGHEPLEDVSIEACTIGFSDIQPEEPVIPDTAVGPTSATVAAQHDKENFEAPKTQRSKQKARQASPKESSPTKASTPPLQEPALAEETAVDQTPDLPTEPLQRSPSIPIDSNQSKLRDDFDFLRLISEEGRQGSVPAPAPRDEAPAPLMNWQSLLGLSPPQSSESTNKEKDSNPSGFNSFFGDDDLGFDPFNESTKGLAKLLEEERVRHHQPVAPAAIPISSQRSSLRDLWNQPSTFPTFGAQPMHGLPQHNPFDMFGVLPQVHQPQLNGGYVNGMHLQQQPPSLFADLLMSHHQQQQQQHQQQQQQQSMYAPPPGFAPQPVRPQPNTQSMAEWQAGLKALLPNVNVRFAAEIEQARWQPHQMGQVPPPPGFPVHNR